jgi:hypothetical protein
VESADPSILLFFFYGIKVTRAMLGNVMHEV